MISNQCRSRSDQRFPFKVYPQTAMLIYDSSIHSNSVHHSHHIQSRPIISPFFVFNVVINDNSQYNRYYNPQLIIMMMQCIYLLWNRWKSETSNSSSHFGSHTLHRLLLDIGCSYFESVFPFLFIHCLLHYHNNKRKSDKEGVSATFINSVFALSPSP